MLAVTFVSGIILCIRGIFPCPVFLRARPKEEKPSNGFLGMNRIDFLRCQLADFYGGKLHITGSKSGLSKSHTVNRRGAFFLLIRARLPFWHYNPCFCGCFPDKERYNLYSPMEGVGAGFFVLFMGLDEPRGMKRMQTFHHARREIAGDIPPNHLGVILRPKTRDYHNAKVQRFYAY